MFFPADITKKVDKRVERLIKALYEKARLKPNNITFLTVLFGIMAAVLLYFNNPLWGLALLASLIMDVLDGAMARRYKLVSKKGEVYDTISGIVTEFAIIFVLAVKGMVPLVLAALSYYAVMLNILLRKKAKFDAGIKRAPILFGYVLDFEIIFTFIFFVNIFSFILQLVIIDYRHTKSIKKSRDECV